MVEREATEVTTVHPTSILTVVGLNIGRGDDLTKYVYIDPNQWSGRTEAGVNPTKYDDVDPNQWSGCEQPG